MNILVNVLLVLHNVVNVKFLPLIVLNVVVLESMNQLVTVQIGITNYPIILVDHVTTDVSNVSILLNTVLIVHLTYTDLILLLIGPLSVVNVTIITMIMVLDYVFLVQINVILVKNMTEDVKPVLESESMYQIVSVHQEPLKSTDNVKPVTTNVLNVMVLKLLVLFVPVTVTESMLHIVPVKMDISTLKTKKLVNHVLKDVSPVLTVTLVPLVLPEENKIHQLVIVSIITLNYVVPLVLTIVMD
jgi:hypothetical protein